MARNRFFKDEEEEKKRAQQEENKPAPAQPQPAAPKPATNYAGVRSGAKGKVATQEEWQKTQNIAKTRQALEQTDYKVTERNWDKNNELGKRRYNARLARHAVGLKTEQEKAEETPNKMKIDFRSVKDNNQAVYLAASLHGKAKSQFLKDYAKYSNQNVQTLYSLADEQEGLFTSKMSTKGQLKQLGLYTINGEEIDVDTASPDAIVQGIRDIADPDKRETAIKLLQSMTRDEDSRFYGYNAYSQDYSFRDSAVLTEAGYKKYAKDLEGMFDPREDMLEDSLRAYANAYADLEDQGAYVLAQELPLLEEAFKKQMGVASAPEIGQLRKMFESEDSIRATRQVLGEKEEEKKTVWGRVKAWFDDFSLKNVFERDDEEEPEESDVPEDEQSEETAMETQEYPVRRVASASSDVSRIFSEKATGTLTGPAFPEIPEEKTEMQGPEWKPEQSNAARATEKVNMTDDPVGALVGYVFKGNGDQLDDATKEALNQYTGNAEMRALLGILDDQTGAEARAGNANIKYAVLANTALLGPMAEHAQKLHSKGYLAELSDDAEALLVDMVHEASTMSLTDEELAAINAGETNRCTLYCEKNPDKLSALNDAFAFSEERNAAAREQKVLDAQAALDQARTRCRTGYATESDWEMVYSHAPIVPRAEKRGDQSYAQTFGMIDQMLWEANESGDMSSWFNSQAAKYLSENGAYVDVSSKEALKFKADLQEYMWEALGSDYDVAYALGYENLDAFWKATGTGSVDALQAKAIALYEADVRQMSETEESPYQGDGSTGTGEALAKGAESGIAQNLANNLEALATLGVITDNEIERFEVRDFYYSNGSFVDAEARCKADLYAMLEGGYFPNEEVAKHITEYLEAGGMALDLGIMPSKFGWTVAKNANEQKQRYEDLVEWSYENLTSGQGKAFGITASTVSNTIDQAESFLLSLPLAAAPGVSGLGRNLVSTFNMMMAYGAPTYLEGVNTALSGGANFAGANMMGTSMAFAQGMAETFTDLGIADDALRAMGVKDLLGAGMEQAGSTAARRWWHATKAAIKQTAEVAAEEVTKDEFFEGVFTEGAKAGTWKAIELTNGFTELPNPSQIMKIAGAALKGGVNAVGPTTRELVNNLGENLIATLPIAMISGGISGVGDWRSTRDIKTAMTTGDPKDVARAGESLVSDMSDPEKAAAVDKAAADIRVNKIASDILVADEGEIGSLMARARAAREQAKSHEATLLKSLEANRAAQRAMAAAQAKIDGGDVSATALQELNDATEAYAKSRNNMDESQREYSQKKAESDSLHGEAVTKAKAEASKQVQQERAAIAQNVQTTQEARAQEKEAAAVAQEETNSYEMEADAWLDAQHKDAPEAERAKLRQRYIDRAKQRAQGAPVSAPETNQQTEGQITPEQREKIARVERFARSVGNRFGVNISFEDRNGEILRGNRGGYSRKANTIYLPKDAAQGDVVRAVFSHELTHRAEESKFYREMADALLEWKYSDNVKQREADRKARYDLYKPQYQNTAERAAEFEKNGDAIAESEQVARIAEELFAADEKALDRLIESKPGIVRRIADTIKEVIDRFRGVKDPQLDAMRRVEKYMRKALDQVEKNRRGEYSGDAGDIQFAADDKSKLVTYSRKDYNNFGWAVDSGAITPAENSALRNRLAEPKKSVMKNKTRDGYVISEIGKEFGINNLLIVSDGKYQSPRVERIYRINYSNETDIDEVRREIYEREKTTGRNAMQTVEAFFGDGIVVCYRAEDWADYSEYSARTGSRSAGGESGGASGPSEGLQERGGRSEEAAGDLQYAVPEDDLIDQQIDAWIDSSTALEPRTRLTDQTVQYGDGERQFATQTAQRSEAMPDWLKENLFSDPEQRYYQRDTNDAQLMRAWNGILNEGYEQTRDRILQKKEPLNADEVASANAIMAMAFRNNDMNTAMLMAHKYNSDGTTTGQALQARKLFSRMTPTGLKAKVAGEYEAKTAEYIKNYKPAMKDVRRRAQKKADKIKDLQGGDELLRLTSGGSYTIKQNKWNMPLNEQQLELIKLYKLEKVARPGLTYNRATTKQRMLEAILATPNPLELTGNGLNLIERLEMLNDGLAVVTNADLDYIGRMLAEYAYADADTQQAREGDLALSRAYEAYGNIDPATLSEKMRTWGYVSMLLSVPSALRNVIGNSGQNALNAAADAIAVELDRAVSLATGERTRAHLTMRERADGWHAFTEETKNTWRDYFSDKTVVQKGEERFSMNQRGRVYQSDALEAARIVEGFLMSVGDRNFWKKKYVNSMAEQMRIAELNGVEFDYDAAVEIAEAEANYATFNEDSKVRDLLAQAKQIPGIGWLIHFAMPFTGVPTNIAKRSLQYSPLGLVTTAVKLGWNAAKGKTFDQRAFVNGMARGLTGTAMWGLGMALMKLGLIHLGTSDDEDDLYNLNTAQGEQYSPYMQVGDEYVSLAAFAPSVSAMVMGAKCAQLLEKDDDLFNALYNSCFASLDQIIDASYLSGLQDMFDAYGEGGVAGAATSIAASAISQNTPALLRQIATALDPYTRDTKDANDIMAAVKYAAAGVPFLREEVLPAKVDVTGEKVASKEGWRNFLDPFTTTKVRGDATLDELERLWRDTGGDVALPTFLVPNSGKITILAAVADKTRDMDRSKGENKLTMTSEQRVKYNEMYGKQVFAAIKKTVESRKYQRADDAERVQMLADLKKNELQEIRLDMQRQICIEFGFTF